MENYPHLQRHIRRWSWFHQIVSQQKLQNPQKSSENCLTTNNSSYLGEVAFHVICSSTPKFRGQFPQLSIRKKSEFETESRGHSWILRCQSWDVHSWCSVSLIYSLPVWLLQIWYLDRFWQLNKLGPRCKTPDTRGTGHGLSHDPDLKKFGNHRKEYNIQKSYTRFMIFLKCNQIVFPIILDQHIHKDHIWWPGIDVSTWVIPGTDLTRCCVAAVAVGLPRLWPWWSYQHDIHPIRSPQNTLSKIEPFKKKLTSVKFRIIGSWDSKNLIIHILEGFR